MKIWITGTDRELKKLNELTKNSLEITRFEGKSNTCFEIKQSVKAIKKLATIYNFYER